MVKRDRGGEERGTARAWAATAATLLLLGGTTGTGCREAASLPRLPPPSVQVATVSPSAAASELRLSGSLEASRSWSLAFATGGTVTQLAVREGEAVRAGQVLARVDARSYEDLLAIARARAEQAEDAHRRLAPMGEAQTVAAVKLVEVATGLRQATLSVSLAEKSLADTVLRAPAAGVVARRWVEPGMVAGPGTPVVTLLQLDTLLATAPLPEQRVAAIKVGDPAQVEVPAVGRTLTGTVQELGLVADPLTRTYPVKIALTNPGDLRVGMIAKVRLRVAAGPPTLVLPIEAVRLDDRGARCVYVVGANERLARRQVEVAGFVDEGLAVSAGVAAGERVVVSGTPMLADGLAVRVVPGPEALR